MANGVRSLSGEGAPADMIGAEPEGDMAADTGSIDDLAPPADAGADMAADAEAPADDFAAAEPAAGGAEEAGRAKRESIEQQNRLLKVLAG